LHSFAVFASLRETSLSLADLDLAPSRKVRKDRQGLANQPATGATFLTGFPALLLPPGLADRGLSDRFPKQAPASHTSAIKDLCGYSVWLDWKAESGKSKRLAPVSRRDESSPFLLLIYSIVKV
jgi:hypothetical protein